MTDNLVKCVVQVSHLTLGGREGHEEQKTYQNGDTISIPLTLAKELDTSIKILTKKRSTSEIAKKETEESTANNVKEGEQQQNNKWR